MMKEIQSWAVEAAAAATATEKSFTGTNCSRKFLQILTAIIAFDFQEKKGRNKQISTAAYVQIAVNRIFQRRTNLLLSRLYYVHYCCSHDIELNVFQFKFSHGMEVEREREGGGGEVERRNGKATNALSRHIVCARFFHTGRWTDEDVCRVNALSRCIFNGISYPFSSRDSKPCWHTGTHGTHTHTRGNATPRTNAQRNAAI